MTINEFLIELKQAIEECKASIDFDIYNANAPAVIRNRIAGHHNLGQCCLCPIALVAHVRNSKCRYREDRFYGSNALAFIDGPNIGLSPEDTNKIIVAADGSCRLAPTAYDEKVRAQLIEVAK